MNPPFHRANDRDAIIVLIVVIVACIVLIPLLATKGEADSSDNTAKTTTSDKYYAQPSQKVELFPFDPNTADSTQLLRLGLKPWQVRSIYKYRAKGGYYRTKEHFAQLFGLTIEKYRELEPYIRIKPQVMAADVIKLPKESYKKGGSGYGNDDANHYSQGGNNRDYSNQGGNNRGYNQGAYNEGSAEGNKGGSGNYGNYKKKKSIPKGSIDINTADTTELQKIPGIGPYFAMRIVDLRKRKVMFTSLDELLIIDNFPESTFQYMKLTQNFPPIHINTMTQKELEHHPLISYSQAREIERYRKFVGKIKSVQDLSQMTSFSKAKLEKISPFLVFD